MELVDVADSKSADGDIVGVRVPPPAPRKSAVDDTIDCGLFNFLYEKALKLRELRDTGVQIASGVPLFSFWGPGDRYGEGKNLNPSPVSLEGKLKDWRKIKMWPPVLPKETGGHAHVFFSRFLNASQPFTKPTREFHTRP